MIIGLCGFPNSGKTTVAKILSQNHDFEMIAFSDPLKIAVAQLFNWNLESLKGFNKESRIWREQPDEFWSKELGRKTTPRSVMQVFGSECMRESFHNDFWALIAKKRLLDNPGINFVFHDVRFSNEKNMIESLGGHIWTIKRGKNPEWFDKALSDNTKGTNFMKNYDVHYSDWAWLTSNKFDIENDEFLIELENKVKSLLRDLKG